MSDPVAQKTQELIAHPVVVIDQTGALVARRGLENQHLGADQALQLLSSQPALICHQTFLLERLMAASTDKSRTINEQRHFDVCELFAFVCPALMATPTPQGLAKALGLLPSDDDTATLKQLIAELLTRLTDRQYPHRHDAAQSAKFLQRGRWPFADMVLACLTHDHGDMKLNEFATGLNVWDRLEEWEDDGPRPPGSHIAVKPDEASDYLSQIIGSHGEHRQQQFDYCREATRAFQPRQHRRQNTIVLAEAGTGLGKTLGYLAPSAIWADRNKAPVWISTYTKNLQRQLEQETHRLIKDPAQRRSRVVIRKGRENYACLLNMQDAFAALTSQNPKTALMAALVARWARYSRDGDMVGGDFPAWLMGLFFPERARGGRTISPASLGMTDRRGECIFAACPHYRKCFIEKSVRAARKADLVIANHALVLFQAAVEYSIGTAKPATDDDQADDDPGFNRLVFDEGHHLFDAADSAFSAHITGMETAELRRWVRGSENQHRRGRSLKDRIGDLLDDDEESKNLLEQVLRAAMILPGPGWQSRIQAGMGEGHTEKFLVLVRQQVLARSDNRSMETDCRPMIDGLAAAAGTLAAGFIDLKRPLTALANRFLQKLADEADELDTIERNRLEALAMSMKRRGELTLNGWIDMLSRLLEETDSAFVEWFEIEQQYGMEFDFGMHSHWKDPSEPLAGAVLAQADGVIITSATLKDRPPSAPDDWEHAEMRTGAIHLPYSVIRVAHESPFDYLGNSRLIVVNDMGRDNMDHLAAAYRELFLAAGGGSLGLFTAISRLRAVHQRLSAPLAAKGLALYAQHVDPMDTGTLVDMFRADRDSCLLGTDAVRDGVDVPGGSLRLIVQDRVPWPRPTILERQRREAFGGSAWMDMLVRLRLRQAFGRLIRRKTDRGIFVMLDSRLASRFKTAFPEGMEIERMGLVEALEIISNYRFTT